jgi:uncharacterized protein with HEPN domain
MTSFEERSLAHWLRDIVDWSLRIESHIAGLTEAQFVGDPKTQDAVIRCIECIGEASKKIMALKTQLGAEEASSDFFEAYWARNRLAHGYFDVDISRVWVTATESVPRLSSHVSAMLKRRSEAGNNDIP